MGQPKGRFEPDREDKGKLASRNLKHRMKSSKDKPNMKKSFNSASKAIGNFIIKKMKAPRQQQKIKTKIVRKVPKQTDELRVIGRTLTITSNNVASGKQFKEIEPSTSVKNEKNNKEKRKKKGILKQGKKYTKTTNAIENENENESGLQNDNDVLFKFTPAGGNQEKESLLQQLNKPHNERDNELVASIIANETSLKVSSPQGTPTDTKQVIATGDDKNNEDNTNSRHVTFGAEDIRLISNVTEENIKTLRKSFSAHCGTDNTCSDNSLYEENKTDDDCEDPFDLLAESPCTIPSIASTAALKEQAIKNWTSNVVRTNHPVPSCGKNMDVQESDAGRFKRTQMEVIANENVAIITEEGATEEKKEVETMFGMQTFCVPINFAIKNRISEKIGAAITSGSNKNHGSSSSECKVDDNIPIYALPTKDQAPFDEDIPHAEMAQRTTETTKQEKFVADIRKILSDAGNKLKTGVSKVSTEIGKSAVKASERAAEAHIPMGIALCSSTQCSEETTAQCHGGASAFRKKQSDISLLSVTHEDFKDWDTIDESFNESFSLDVTAISRVDTDSLAMNQ